MGRYRVGLWLLVGGMVLHLGHVVANELVRQLVETQVLASYPLRYVAVVGYISFAISCVMIAGAVLASVGSDGTRRWWFAGAASATPRATARRPPACRRDICHVPSGAAGPPDA